MKKNLYAIVLLAMAIFAACEHGTPSEVRLPTSTEQEQPAITKPTPEPASPPAIEAEKPEAETKPEAKPETKPEAQPEEKPETKPEDKPEAKPETKPETKPEAKPEVEAPEAETPEVGEDEDEAEDDEGEMSIADFTGSVEEAVEWLSRQETNKADSPYSIEIAKRPLAGLDMSSLNKAKHYFSLDLEALTGDADENTVFLRGNEYLIGLALPEGLTSIPENAFKSNKELRLVNLPSTIKEIGVSAFERCTKLEMIILPAKNVPITDSTAFNYVPKGEKAKLTVYVPSGTVKAYETYTVKDKSGKKVEIWNQFHVKDIMEFLLQG
ncbi:MAG: leucine-rich repeat protein [Spirochaetaceae bacterium]|jgi:hypothetical protein|nr:leucine-rich repeat protein [Spirochaetaceae bacterium]